MDSTYRVELKTSSGWRPVDGYDGLDFAQAMRIFGDLSFSARVVDEAKGEVVIAQSGAVYEATNT